MSEPTRYPFSDLTRPEVEAIMRAARAERAQAMRNFVLSLFRRRPKASPAPAEFATPAAARA